MNEPSAEVVKSGNRDLWIETGVVLLVFIAPWLYTSAAAIYFVDDISYRQSSFLEYALSDIVRHAGVIALILFLIWRAKEPFPKFGVLPFRAVIDLLQGAGIYIVGSLVVRGLWLVTQKLLSHQYYG